MLRRDNADLECLFRNEAYYFNLTLSFWSREGLKALRQAVSKTKSCSIECSDRVRIFSDIYNYLISNN